MPKKRNKIEVVVAVAWAGSLGILMFGIAIAWFVRVIKVFS